MKPSGWLFIERISLECLPTALTLLTLVYQVRTIIKDSEPWFVAKDVCDVLEHSNSRMVIERLDDDEKGVSPLDTPGGTQEMAIINEAGLYMLLFNMQPQNKSTMTDEQFNQRVESIKQFKRWIIHEVLPSIRQHGIYAVDTVISVICRYLAFLRWNNPHILTESFNISQDKKDSARQQRSNMYLAIAAAQCGFSVLWGIDNFTIRGVGLHEKARFVSDFIYSAFGYSH